MSKKLTAVEWLVLKLNQEGYAPVVTQEEYNQAKEMEKQQMCQFAFDYQDEFFNNGKVLPIEQYYNQTYGGDNE
jgi:hypothetical protein